MDACAGLRAAEDLAAGDAHPAVFLGGPGAPSAGDALEVGPRRVAIVEGLGGEERLGGAVGPAVAPPLALGGGRVGPGGQRAADVSEARLAGPGVQHPAGVRLPAGGAGDAAVQRAPLLQDGGGGVPEERAGVAVAGGD